LQKLQAVLDRSVAGVKLGSAGIGVNGIGNLVVARLVERTQIVPHFRNVRVQADGARVGVERVAVLVDLVVQHTDRAPKGGITAVPIDGLLIRFVRLVVPLTSHEGAA
jgi:hypothetical protein